MFYPSLFFDILYPFTYFNTFLTIFVVIPIQQTSIFGVVLFGTIYL